MQNRMKKYLLYAIGEIILVMIGILLAFQVNTWRDNDIKAAKEVNYISDIKSNLQDDLASIDKIVNFNQQKIAKCDSIFTTMGRISDPSVYMPILNSYMFFITEYYIHASNKTAFENMLGAESIDLISNDSLKLQLSHYYKKDFTITTQESVKLRSRQFGDYVALEGFNRETILGLLDHESSLRPISEVSFHTDEKFYAHLFSMMITTQTQIDELLIIRAEIEALIELIEGQEFS